MIDHWLAYATGGFAYGKIDFNGSAQPAAPGAGPNQPLTWRAATVRPGWVIGAGVENALSAGWSWKFEYLFMNFGTTANMAGQVTVTAHRWAHANSSPILPLEGPLPR